MFAAILDHDVVNVSFFMFPNFGSHYDPNVTGLIIVGAATVIAIVWGLRTLTRKRTA